MQSQYPIVDSIQESRDLIGHFIKGMTLPINRRLGRIFDKLFTTFQIHVVKIPSEHHWTRAASTLSIWRLVSYKLQRWHSALYLSWLFLWDINLDFQKRWSHRPAIPMNKFSQHIKIQLIFVKYLSNKQPFCLTNECYKLTSI